MDLDDLELNATIASPYAPGWSGEQAPQDWAFKALGVAFAWLKEGKAAEALGELMRIRDDDLSRFPNFAMRRDYYVAAAYFDIAEHVSSQEAEAALGNALDYYRRALSRAVSGNDTLSQVLLHRMLGEAHHNLQDYEHALSEYLTAYSTLQRFPVADATTSARAEIKLRMRIARQQYLLGQYAAALDNIDTARELRARFGGPATTQWDRAAEEWIEAMIVRAESQRCGGDVEMLRRALRLFKSAETRLQGDDEHRSSLRRLYIQIAETHLDLAERYRAMGNVASYNQNMKLAEDYAIKASDALHSSDDAAGRAMATLALLRHDHLSLKAYELAPRIYDVEHGGDFNSPQEHALAPRIYDVERMAVEMGDLVLIARTATLRADVMSAMHDYAAAMAVYYFAIATFEAAGARGEATRAIYGVRRILDII